MATTQKTIVPFVVTAEGTGVAQELTVAGEVEHHFSADTYPAFGGADAAPSPLSYALGALTSCNQVTGSLVAGELGVTLGAWHIEVRGDLDPSVLVGGAEGNANFDRVAVRVSVETDADEATFARLATETERRCPVSQLFVRSGVEWDNAWTNVPLP